MAARPLYRLDFTLPPVIGLVAPGRHHPCLHGCVLTVAPDGRVRVEGLSRERVFDQARRFLRIAARGHLPGRQGRPKAASPLSLIAVLTTPRQPHRGVPGGQDGWTIILGAEVAFAPTTLPPDIGVPELGAPESQPAAAIGQW